MTAMLFRSPWLLLLALAVPVALWMRRRGRPAVLFAPPVADLPRTLRERLAAAPRALQVAGLGCALVALARPVERVPLPETRAGLDLVLCLDTSSSMKQTDMGPGDRTRLAVAKREAAAFVRARADDRIGLVAFARYPDVRCPPTLDHEALLRFLDAVEPVAGDGPEDATGIGTAVARAADVLRARESRARVVVLLTDGEENVATADKPDEIAPVHAGQLCRRLGVRVYAIAAGRGRRAAAGEVVKPDTRQVRRLAEGTGGRFFEAENATAMQAVYGEIDALERVDFAEPKYALVEGFDAWLLAALALLLSGRAWAAGREALP